MTRPLAAVALATALSWLPSSPAVAQSTEAMEALAREVAALREAQAAMQRDVQEIKALLQQALNPSAAGAAAAPRPEISLPNAPVRGRNEATTVVVEFSDFHCPFCSQYTQQVYPRIGKEYIDTGRIAYMFVNFPIDALHPRASKAHEAALCAGDQGRFWEMHDRIFAHVATAQTPEQLVGHAGVVGVDLEKFRACLDGGRRAEDVRQDVARAQSMGVRATPTFIIGTREPGGTIRVAQVISGAQPYDAFKAALDRVIGGSR